VTGTAADVIRVAKSQVGYHEGYSGGHWTNKQKYSPAVPGLEWSQNQAWCATFCAWVFQEAGMPKGNYPVTASCALGVSWWKKAGRWSDYPAIGAQAFFGAGGGSHTGLVYAYDESYIYTVEGNTNSSGSAEGDGVYLKKRARRDSYVHGYGYPAYPAGIVTADPTWKNPSPPQEESMPLTKADVATIFKTDGVIAVPADWSPGNDEWTAASLLIDMGKRLRSLQANDAAQSAAIGALATALGHIDAAVDVPALVAEVRGAVQQAVESIDVRLEASNG
jgi:hypothetical protein